ncbi:PREDICTED: tRNA pseudouridine(38/39) synthase isoform X2 [Tarenaya hassleriana]|uniref:tRNA pseudouridine(38/39) synthase isoform X2 n=1 Tax=Tarenaya hassleriana TaxID=28532 RepID=UPI00053C7573|nr:PREDICTED: tRNA pseudouridine(38/39) synthase isoform X2 [Tarenaya hassleriana]
MSAGESDPDHGQDSADALRSELEFLRNRIKELEIENGSLLSRVSSCKCQQMEVMHEGLVSDAGSLVVRSKKVRTGDVNKIPSNLIAKRYVALKVMYFGKRFYGFASEAQMEPTVESEIFKALEKTRLLVGDKKESCYSRCGRTDKGVSSTGQVIALFIRSKLKPPFENIVSHSDEQIDDIRVMGWCPAPLDFHARFSCLAREYKYFFWRESLDLSAMDIAGKKFIGEHDFRNFCKMDAANVHNYKRRVTFFEVSSCHNSSEGDDQLCAFTIRGSAFLWHQIRCMVAVLFMIGQGAESLDVIDSLLDIERTPRKPQYKMAPEIPLVLRSCEFQHLNFICSSDAAFALRSHLKCESLSYRLQSAIFHEAIQLWLPSNNDQSSCNAMDRKKKGAVAHVPILSRPTEPSYEERRAKLESKQRQAHPDGATVGISATG